MEIVELNDSISFEWALGSPVSDGACVLQELHCAFQNPFKCNPNTFSRSVQMTLVKEFPSAYELMRVMVDMLRSPVFQACEM